MLQASLLRAGAFCVLFSVCSIIYFLKKSLSKPKLFQGAPYAGLDGGRRTLDEARQRFLAHGGDMIQEGYDMTNGGFYYVPSPSYDRLMIPAKYAEELKNAPDSKADFTGSFVEMFEGEYTTIGKRWHLHPLVIRASLNGQLGTILSSVAAEIPLAFTSVFPACDTWTPIPIADALTEIVAQATGRLVGGTSLSRNQEWLRTSIDFATDTFAAAQKLKSYPTYLRPLMQYLIPELRLVHRDIKIARKHIKPLLRAREQRKADLGEKGKEVDLLQMMTDGAKGEDTSHDFLSYATLAVSFASIHPVARSPVHLILDLCAHPEYIAPLKEEVEMVLREEDGVFTKAGLARMVKMDSVMKESRRFNPMVFMTFGRHIRHDLTLHDGTTIPANTIIGIPSAAIDHDPSFYPSPSTFDGYRHLNAKASFTTSNESNMHWGYGTHACSGRFFAAMEIKMIMAHVLLEYDFRFEEGTVARPANVSFELQNSVDPGVRVLFRRRGKAT